LPDTKKANKLPVVVLVAVGIVVLLGVVYFGWRHWQEGKGTAGTKEPPMHLSPAGKQVGSIDRDALYKLPEFVEIEKAMKQKTQEMELRLRSEGAKIMGSSAGAKAHPKPSPEQDRALRTLYYKMEMDLQQTRNQLMSPLVRKLEAAVAVVALKRKMNAVLDRRIVVYGAPDITADVKELMEKQKEITSPAEKPGGTPQIGYFNQQVINNLPMFRDLYTDLEKVKMDLGNEYKKREGKLKNDAERQDLLVRMNQALEMKKNELLQPLLKKVTEVVEETAKEQNLALVLDQENVMYGGVNLTDSVTKKLLLKKK